MKSPNLIAKQPFGFLVNLTLLLSLTFLIPPEQSLGKTIRLVYFHGAWVWAGIFLFGFAGLCGLLGVILNKNTWRNLSRSAAYTALFFWLTYLPMSLWLMKSSWGGFYFAEPRWQVPFSFAITSVLLQIGLLLVNNLNWTALSNFGFGAALYWALFNTQSVLHPESPVKESSSLLIQLCFWGMLLLTLLLAGQITGWVHTILLPRLNKKT